MRTDFVTDLWGHSKGGCCRSKGKGSGRKEAGGSGGCSEKEGGGGGGSEAEGRGVGGGDARRKGWCVVWCVGGEGVTLWEVGRAYVAVCDSFCFCLSLCACASFSFSLSLSLSLSLFHTHIQINIYTYIHNDTIFPFSVFVCCLQSP